MKKTRRTDSRLLKAYLAYAASFEVLVLAISWFMPGSIGHNVAHNWLLALVLLAAPIYKLGLGFMWVLLVHAAVLTPAFAAHTLVAFVGRAHEPLGALQLLPFSASLALYAGAAGLSSAIARRADTRFRITFPIKHTAEPG